MSIYFCGGSCIEDVTTHLMNHLSLHPTLRTCSSDTILRAIKELTQENISYTSNTCKNYDFNTADTLNTLLLNCMFASGQLKDGEMYDVDHSRTGWGDYLKTKKKSPVNLSIYRTLLRRERDSNPRYLSVRRFSRPVHSTTLPSLLYLKKLLCVLKRVQRYRVLSKLANF